MKQHYKPMLAQLAKTPFDSKDWIFEIKWDGIRGISYVNDRLSIRSGNQKELRHNFPELDELKKLSKNVVIDGEIVIMKDGAADFEAILERSLSTTVHNVEYLGKRFPATYVVFDILEKENMPLTSLPLTERKKILAESVKEGKHVVLSMFVEEEGKDYYEAAVRRGVEGVIAKKKDSLYEPGTRSNNWLKIKKELTCDCVVFGFTTGEGIREETFGALILGLYDKMTPIYVGKVGTGFSQTGLQDLRNRFREIEMDEKTLQGVDARDKITWLKPEMVCEVLYQSLTKDGKLRMPRFSRLRTDKPPNECTIDQVKSTQLQEYESKRDFKVSPEPKGDAKGDGRIFVVQEHHARRLHYDLRLEKDGVLKSWAVPKGLPMNPGEKRLAIEVEDHPLDYGNFEGTIPSGQYGAGTVKIWDRGTYEFKVWNDDMIEFMPKGETLEGRYILARFKKAGKKQWLLFKAKS